MQIFDKMIYGIAVMAFLPFNVILAQDIVFPDESDSIGMETADLLHRDFSFIRQSDPWLSGNNAAALTRFSTGNISRASVSASYGKGGFVDYYQSPEVVQAGADAESLYRLSERTVVWGKMSYDNFSGKKMGGSVFVDSRRLPFDIVEDSLGNEGKKHRDTYRLSGGVGVNVAGDLALGLKIDYTSANYAKYKDLRHKNSLMDMNVSVGAYYNLLSLVAVGADVFYHRNTESLSFRTYGSDDKTYKSLVSYGALTGRVEQFGNSGYTDSSREMPLFEDGTGADGQIELRLGRNLTWYHCLSYLASDGYYGRKSPYTITYSSHERKKSMYEGMLSLRGATALHQLSYNISAEYLQNSEKNYLERKNDNAASYYEYFDDVLAGEKRWKEFEAAYTGYYDIRGELPTWIFSVSYNNTSRLQNSYIYPYKRRQQLTINGIGASLTRNILFKKGVIDTSVRVSYKKGNGDRYEDITYIEPSDQQTTPAEMTVYQNREYEYLTSPQYTVGISAGYSFMIPSAGMKMNVKAFIDHRKSNGSDEYIAGDDHTVTGLSIGCCF